MANKERGEIKVTVAGADYVLRPTFQAMCDIEDFTGMGVIPLASKLMAGAAGAREICGVVMCAALQDKPDADRDAFIQAMVDDGMGRLVPAALAFVQGFLLGGQEGNGPADVADKVSKTKAIRSVG